MWENNSRYVAGAQKKMLSQEKCCVMLQDPNVKKMYFKEHNFCSQKKEEMQRLEKEKCVHILNSMEKPNHRRSRETQLHAIQEEVKKPLPHLFSKVNGNRNIEMRNLFEENK